MQRQKKGGKKNRKRVRKSLPPLANALQAKVEKETRSETDSIGSQELLNSAELFQSMEYHSSEGNSKHASQTSNEAKSSRKGSAHLFQLYSTRNLSKSVSLNLEYIEPGNDFLPIIPINLIGHHHSMSSLLRVNTERQPQDNESSQDSTSPISIEMLENVNFVRRPTMKLFRGLGMDEPQSPSRPRASTVVSATPSEAKRKSLSVRRSSEIQRKSIVNNHFRNEIDADEITGNVFINAALLKRQSLKLSLENTDKIPEAPPGPHLPPLPTIKPTIDYSEIFEDLFGNTLGLFVFRIENFVPVVQPLAEQGTFCIADSYIVLNTIELDPGKYENQISTWIGSHSETDKKFCCAMYAVALRNKTNSNTRISRQTEYEEEEEFIKLFGDKFQIIDESFGTTTALFVAQEKEYSTQLFRIDGHQRLIIRHVPLCEVTLESHHVYVLDAGLYIYEWVGAASSIQHRLKGRIFCDRIKSHERAGKAEIIEIEEVDMDDIEHFMSYLVPKEECDHDHDTDYDIDTLMYELHNNISDSLEDHVLQGVQLSRKKMKSNCCYVLDTGPEIALWIGNECTAETKELSNEFISKIVKLRERPNWALLSRVAEGAEPESFKMRLHKWEAEEKPIIVKPPKEAIKMDLDAIYVVPDQTNPDLTEVETRMQIANNYLQTFSTFVFQKGKFMNLPENERGHFFYNDAYIFLCVYHAPKEALENLIQHSVDDSEFPLLYDSDPENKDYEMQCVVYFCQSHRASKVAYSTFKLSTQIELEELVRGMYDCDIRVEIVEYGREPFALMAHLENNIIMHEGSRIRLNTAQDKVCFQIRTDFRYGSTRAYQVKLNDLVLTTIDSLYIEGTNDNYLFKGENVLNSSFETAIELSCKISDFYHPKSAQNESENRLEYIENNQNEECELPFRILESTQTVIEFDELMRNKLPPISLSLVKPRFFICNTREGFFKVTRLAHYTQTNLHSDSCVIIDQGAPDPVFCWMGANASENVQKMTFYCVDIWLTTCQDGRLFNDSQLPFTRVVSFNSLVFTNRRKESMSSTNLVVIQQGSESPRFKALFQGWEDTLLDQKEPGNAFSRASKKPSPMLF